MTEDNQGVIAEPVAEAPVEMQDAPQHVSDKEMNFEAFRQEVQNLKAQNDYLQRQMWEKQQPQQQPDEFDISKMRDDDIPTYGELKKLRQQEDKERRQYMQQLKDLEARTQYQDYDKVIKEYLPDVLHEEPDLANAIKDNPHLHKLAYKLAQSSPRYHQQKLAAQNQNAVNKIVENSSRPQPATSRKGASYQDEEVRMQSMTDDQIWDAFQMAKARS